MCSRKRYTAAGAVLNTYSFGSNHRSLLPRMAYALDDPVSFWMWNHPDTPAGFSLFHNVRVSDGVVLTTLTVAEFEGGVYEPAASATPTARFGMSFSCPFLVTRAALEAPEEPEESEEPEVPAHHLAPYVIRRLRRAPHVNNENLRVFYRRFELDLERGQAAAAEPGAIPSSRCGSRGTAALPGACR